MKSKNEGLKQIQQYNDTTSFLVAVHAWRILGVVPKGALNNILEICSYAETDDGCKVVDLYEVKQQILDRTLITGVLNF